MGAEHYHFIGPVGAAQEGSYVAGLLDLVSEVHLYVSFHFKREALEAGLLGGGQGRVHIHSGGGKDLAGTVFT